MAAQPVIPQTELLDLDTTFNPDEFESENIDGDQLLKDISAFIGRYLQCSEHQRTVLALWALHTHCLPAARMTPYLAIQSAEKQSGKTLCLQLLSMLCEDPIFTASFTANTLTRRLDQHISTVLLDECQSIFGTRNRSKNPALQALLACGNYCGAGYTDSKHERNTFAPKAFAGMGHLPESLADRSISIILKPLNENTARSAQRFNHQAVNAAKPIQERLQSWALQHDSDFETLPSYSWADFPAGLSPRRQDMIEPLLQLADLVGGDWPARIREALAAVFQEETDFVLRHSIQLLADIRDCFAHHRYPERLARATLLDWMHSRPARPWDADGPITARAIARLLAPFEIHPRPQRTGPEGRLARGYQLGDFKKYWKAHLNFEVPSRPRPQDIFQQLLASERQARQQASNNLEQPESTSSREPANAAQSACYAVTHPGEVLDSQSPTTILNQKQNGNHKPSDEESLPPAWNNGFHATVQNADSFHHASQ
jgi:hypothetical protein